MVVDRSLIEREGEEMNVSVLVTPKKYFLSVIKNIFFKRKCFGLLWLYFSLSFVLKAIFKFSIGFLKF